VTPKEVCEAHDLCRAQLSLRETRSHLTSHPSAWANLQVGKLDREERVVEGPDALVPNGAASAAINAAISYVNARLQELGVAENDS
jgi:hypothetical protein